MKHLVLISIFIFSSIYALAESSRYRIFKENSKERVVVKNTTPISFFYEKAAWNQDPMVIDSGFIYLRDQKTGKLTELTFTETKPNSSVFNLDLPIGGLKDNNIHAELFSAPMSMLKDKNRIDVIKNLIQEKSVKRKPFLLRKLRSKGQIIDVFDSKDLAISAYQKYKSQLSLNNTESDSVIEVKNQEKISKKKIIDTSTLQSLFLANDSDLSSTNDKNKELREVLTEVEKKRRMAVKNKSYTWSNSEKSKNKNTGKELIKTAVEKIKAKDAKGSMDAFYEASNLIADSEDVYEQYGVSLSKAEKYNQSIVVLNLAKNSKPRDAEKLFYLGLNFYHLKDYDNAVKYFSQVMDLKEKSFGPTAAFYKGSALIEMKEFDKSKEAFQYVLDNSSDPNMDSRAEKFIESALDLKALEEKRSNRHFFDGVLGLMYDSNIILATNDAINTNTVTDESGWRLLMQGGYKYRPYYTETNEVSIKADILAMQSFDNGFGSNDEAEKADPYVFSIAVPWTHRGTLKGKGYFFDLTPRYETIVMDLDGTAKKAIVNSIKLDFDNTVVVNKKWIAKGDFGISQNDSSILGDETSADSFGATFKLSSIFILNQDLERYLIPEFGYSLNNAEGSTYSYNRVDLAVSYTSSIFDMFLWNNRLGYYIANYENNRADNNYSLSSGISYHINPHWDWALTGSYSINDSNTNQYDKYSVLSTFSFSY